MATPKRATTLQNGLQVVKTKIQYKNKHLKLENNVGFEKTVNSTKAEKLIWQVEIEDNALKSAVGRVTLWFPDNIQMFADGREITFENLNNGAEEKTLTINDQCPTGTYPFTIFCDIDGGEDPANNFNRPILKPNQKDWEQHGRQIVDGGHSHPDCEVGP